MLPSLRLFLTLVVSGLLFSCSENPETSKTGESKSARVQDSTIIQTYQNVEFIYSENDLNWFGRLDVRSGRDTLITLNENDLELTADQFILDDNVFEMGDKTYLFVKWDNRPEPHGFYVFEFHFGNIKLIGKTGPTTAEFIEDIDNDGRLEIGGYQIHCQASLLEQMDNPGWCLDQLRVYEVGSEIVRDPAAEAEQSERIRLNRLGRTDLSKDVPYSELLPSQVPVECVMADFEILQAFQWKSGNLEYVLVSSRKGPYPTTESHGEDRDNVDMRIAQYSSEGGVFKLLWEETDSIRDCALDMWLGILPNSIRLTDLDRDGITETTFAYKGACRGDIGPSDLFVVMYEDDARMALEGLMMLKFDNFGNTREPLHSQSLFDPDYSRVDTASMTAQAARRETEGRYAHENDFDGQPVAFVNFARRLWLEYVVEEEF